MDRFNQMSGQASLIAKKKAEIEIKRKAQQEAAQNAGSVSVYNQLAGSAGGPVGGSGYAGGPRQQKALPIGSLKNRWGFKGKSSSETQRPSPTIASSDSSATLPSNTFSNDGSFMDKFNKMQQEKVGSKQPLLKSDTTDSKQSTYSNFAPNKSHKDMLSIPPPPPPSLSGVQHERKDTNLSKPAEADQWYQQALERARNIAKNLGQSANPPPLHHTDVLNTNSTLSATHDSPQVKYETGPQLDFSVPPPPVPPNYMHQPPPPPMKSEYGNLASQSGFDTIDYSGEYGNGSTLSGGSEDPNGSTLYSPTKPTATPTKTDQRHQATSDADNKVLPAECKFQPMPVPQLNSRTTFNSDSQNTIKKVESDDLGDVVLSTVAEELASMVACSGDQLENIARNHNAGMEEEELSFLYHVTSKLYRKYRQKVESLRNGMLLESDARQREAEETAIDEISGSSDEKAPRKRKRRWGDENDKVQLDAPVLLPTPGVLPSGPLTGVGKANPELIQYAIRVFGSTDLTESQWKQCEDQIKMSMVYNEMLVKKKQAELLAQKGQNKYAYDSDEETEGGTWEHKARKLEMDKTLGQAEKQTEAGKGNHHIGDFLPPEELTKFMNKFKALQNGEAYDDSDYVESKLTTDNLGFKMLERMGWSEGKGLGHEGQGITAPVGKSGTGADKKGLGVSEVHNLESGDDEFEAYRKRMMLAYRFRPNPLNNPRRAYY